MEDKKQPKGIVFYWVLIDIAFIVTILVLLIGFVRNGKQSATTSSQDLLINSASVWGEKFRSEVELSKEAGNIFANWVYDNGGSLSSAEALEYARNIIEQTPVSHVIMCRQGAALCDENGEDLPNFSVDFVSLTDSAQIAYYYYAGGTFGDGDEVIVYVPVGVGSEYMLLTVNIEEIGGKLQSSVYTDVSFLALMTKEGNFLGCFPQFKDYDSLFLASSNVVTRIYEGVENKDVYNAFKVKFYNATGCAVQSEFKGDSRTICCVPTQVKDWYVVYGVRQTFVNKLINTAFSDTRSTVIKLAVVVIVFSVFVVSTFIFTSLRSKERGKELEDKADTDLLTELNNKAATERKIQEYMEANPNGRALMFILDIDNFKKINDTMGHAFGDTLLKTLGKDIKTEFRMTDIIGRTGGDEFMVFLKDVKDDLIVEREANRITRFFHDFKAGGDYVKYSASASIGAAIFPDDAKTFRDLYVAADQALYKAKKRGKNQLVFYNEAAHKE